MRKRIAFTILLIMASLAMGQEGKSSDVCKQELKGFWREKDAYQAIALFKKLQTAVKRDDRKAVATMISYPLRVSGSHRVYNRTAFLKNYDRIFDRKVRNAISRQVPECINGNWRGFFTETGEIWIEGANNGPMKVVAVNSPSWPKHGSLNSMTFVSGECKSSPESVSWK